MSAEFVINAVGVLAAVIGAIYGIRTFHLNRRGLGMEKPEPKPRPWWTWGTVAVLVGLVWLVAIVHYYSVARPNLEADVDGIVGGTAPDNSDNTVAALNLNIANIGAVQTVIRDWHVTVSADGITYDCTILPIPPKLNFKNPKKVEPGLPDTLTITDDQDLSGISDPIQVGDMDIGVLYVEFPNINTRGAVRFNVSFDDVFSDKYSVTSDIDGEQLLLGVKVPDANAPGGATPQPSATPTAPQKKN